MLRELRKQGMSISEIAKETGYNRRTVRKYVTLKVPPVTKKRSPKAGKLDNYKDYITQRLNSYPLTASRIYRELQERGFTGNIQLSKISFERYVPNQVSVPFIVMKPNQVNRLRWIGANAGILRLMERSESSSVSQWFLDTRV